jgi:hypothetical protein
MPFLKKSRKFALLALAALFICTWGPPAPLAQNLNPRLSLGSKKNQQFFPPPVPLGVSGGNMNDQSAGWCCSGTLGCLVADSGGIQYILSNNHVLAITNNGTPGDPIIQPGLVDTNCAFDPYQTVAHLSDFVEIKFVDSNTVDAAIAEVVPGMVATDGNINLIGTISSQVLANPPLGTKVRKSGRTSGLTNGKIAAVGVTVLIYYETSCGSLSTQTANFVNQLRLRPGGFIKSGDSGSLVVTRTRKGICPQAVGLVFAGSKTDGFVCPIQPILDAFGVTIVGACTGAAAAPAAPEAEAIMAQSAEVARLVDLKKRHHEALFKVPGVVGTGVGLHPETQAPVVEIYVEKDTPEVRRQLPKTLNGAPVQIIETGKVRAL